MLLVSTNPPPCLQVCFYFAPGKKMVHSLDGTQVNGSNGVPEASKAEKVGKRNSLITSRIAQSLVPRGFMVDYAPALSQGVEKGSFFRVVVNISTTKETVERLVEQISIAGKTIQS